MMQINAFQFKWPIFRIIQCALLCSLCTAAASIKPPTSDDQSFRMSVQDKRAKLLKFIEKETYHLTGFDEVATIPVTYPIDICLMELNGIHYVACLHFDTSEYRNQTIFKLFKQIKPTDMPNNYQMIFELDVNDAISMDCGAIGGTGFVVVVKTTDGNADAANGSPIIQVTDQRAFVVQYFAMPRQNTVHLQRGGNNMYLLQTFHMGDNDGQRCPIYKWSDTTFNEIDALPCTNAMRAEAFIIDHEVYIAFANHMDEFNNTEIQSVIYKFDVQKRKFHLLQKIKTYGATDVKYFQLNSPQKTAHFLIIANTFASSAEVAANAVVYEFDGERFSPFQVLNFDAPIRQFQPVSSTNSGFVLLIALEHEVTKSFQFDGRSFFEAKVKFTGGSFGRGVSSMRTHKFNNEEMIVVANTEMLRDATNIFRPKYKKRITHDMGIAIAKFDEWYDEIKQTLNKDRPDELFAKIEAFRKLNVGRLAVQQGRINRIQTDQIKSNSMAVNEKTLSASIQRADDMFARNMLSTVAASQTSQSTTDQSFSASTSIPAIETLDELIVTDDVHVSQTLNNHQIDDLIYTDEDLVLNELNVDHLIVKNAENFTEIQSKLVTQKSVRVRRSVDPSLASVLNVTELFITGRINGFDLADLQENVLRTNGVVQKLTAKSRFDFVAANSVRVRSNIISNQNLGDLVAINGGDVTIDQDIQFTQPVSVNELNILNRLNHIQVLEGRFDALFQRARGPQIISGNKVFQSVTLLEPIFQKGKIEVHSRFMVQIKPVANIELDIELQGDYSITGNVTIGDRLIASNIFGRSGRFSVKQLQTDGLSLAESNINVAMHFAQAIKVDDVVGATNLSGIAVSSLIKRNMIELQSVKGRKRFISDVHVNGHCDADVINGVNLSTLNETILRVNVNGQIVSGTIHIKRIIANNIRYKSLQLGNRLYDRLLTRHTDQILTGNVTVHGSLIVLNNTGVVIRHLSTNNRVFGVALDFLLNDCVMNSNETFIEINSSKRFNELVIGHLMIESDFWRTGTTTAVIEAFYKSLRQDILLDGVGESLRNQWIIGDVTVSGNINGLPSSTFGQEWLLSETDQVFSVSQSFANVNVEDDLTLSGSINGLNLQTLYQETIWRNTMQHVDLRTVVFDNVIIEGVVNAGGRFSGLRIPNDLILRNSSQTQQVDTLFTFDGSVRIYGELFISDTLNRHNFSQMCELIEDSEFSSFGLVVDGDATFQSDPIVEYLNGQLFAERLAETWFIDDKFIDFAVDDIRFDQLTLQRSIATRGNVNGFDVRAVNARYLSLTKSQQISTAVNFQNIVECNEIVTVTSGNVMLNGDLIDRNSNKMYGLADFHDNVLKRTPNAQHIITGDWSFVNVTINGNLSSTRINKLNFDSDIVLINRPESNIIRTAKFFESLTIGNFMCSYGCLIDNVDLGDWMAKAVLLNHNYTIQGTTYLQNPIIDSVTAFGTVNNVTFNADQILLKSKRQRIYGDVHIGNRENPLQKLTFDGIYLNYFNDHNFTDFQLSLVQRPSAAQRQIVATVSTDMQFTKPLTIDNLECFADVNGVNFSALADIKYNRMSEFYHRMMPELHTVADTFMAMHERNHSLV